MDPQNFFKRDTIPPVPPQSSSEKVPLPEMIGPYRVEALLDKGGMSYLYLATHKDTLTPLTLKVLSPRFLSHPEMTKRFLKEAEIIALADHPNIVKLYGYGEWKEGLYIAMEFIHGVSLRQYLTQNPLSLRKALELVLEIAYALCHLHTHGVIHRDLKPENILVNDLGHIKVIDFGIAQLIDPIELQKEEWDGQRRLIGTPVYMSPEQKNSADTVSYPSDIYSLGIIAYEIVLGKLSHGQIHLSLMPQGLQKILAKALQPYIKDRYLDIVDFISDLSTYIHSSQFEKEKTGGEQAGALIEKLQEVQMNTLPETSLELPAWVVDVETYRPFGFNGVYSQLFLEHDFLVLAQSPNLEWEGLLQLMYLKGVIESKVSSKPTLKEWGKALNGLLANAAFYRPLALAVVKLKEDKISFLSCGFGPLWKISGEKIEMLKTENAPLPLHVQDDFTIIEQEAKPGDQFLISPIYPQGYPVTYDQFLSILKTLTSLKGHALPDTLIQRIKSVNLKHFEQHPFLAALIQKK